MDTKKKELLGELFRPGQANATGVKALRASRAICWPNSPEFFMLATIVRKSRFGLCRSTASTGPSIE
jgi:hypothetical protein